MSQESVQDEQVLEFVKKSNPVIRSDEGFDRLKKELLGSKAQYEFQCESCSNTVVTDESYSADEGRVVRGMRRRALYTVLYKVRSYLYPIPYVGSLLSGLLPSTWELDSYTSVSSQKKAKLAAWEEIKDKFHRCSKCGQFVCASCFKNGKCADCRD